MTGSWTVPVRLARRYRLLLLPALLALAVFLAAGCGKKDEAAAGAAPGSSQAQQPAQGQRPGGGTGQRPGGPGGPGAGAGEQAVPVAVSSARIGSISSYYRSTATLEAEREAEVLARVSGVAGRLQAEEGDVVTADGALLKIDNPEYGFRVKQAEAATANLRARFQRLEAMRAEELTTEEEFQAARSELETAEANEGLARLELSYTTVRAPFEGQITQRLINEGQNISIGDPLFVLADFHPLLARVHVPSREFRQLQLNQNVELTLDSDGTQLQGTIRLISPVIDATSGTIKITVEVDGYPAGTRPGDFAEVRIVTERRDDVVLVPRSAVITDKGDQIVYVALPGEGDATTAERRIVEVGFTDDEDAQITGGLESGERIVVKGQRSLKHGSPLKILETIDAGAALLMQSFVELAVRRRVSVVMAALAVVAFGLVAYDRLALELFPDIAYPSLTIQTEFPDTAPQEVENLVTRPVEEAVGVLRGLQTVHSVSRPGVSEVTLEFEWGSDMDLLSMEVREKLDRLVLPEEALDPVVLRYDPSLDPILRLALSGDGDLMTLRRLADKQIKQDFETIKGVAAATIKGGLEEEIQIEVDQGRLAALGISLDQVQQVVGVSNVNLPGGALRGRDSQFLIRTINEYDDVDEIADLIISSENGAQVRLRDVAEVYWGHKEREEITRAGGQEAVEISLYKEGDANTVMVARRLQERLAEWQDGKLPPGARLDVLFDQSKFIQQSVDEVRSSALIGGVLAIVVLLLFLRDIRSTLIIATSIPISVVATFIAMYKLDLSLNIMSLGGLTLGIGMLVDNSIVVLESIFRKRQQGVPLFAAAVTGTSEVGAAVIASTLTTVAVFLPIVFVEGIAGQLFRDQALTVTFSLLASLVVAVTLIPMLSAAGARLPKAGSLGLAPGQTVTVDETADEGYTLGWFSVLYDRLLRSSLRLKWLTLAIGFGLFFASVAAIGLIGTELIPQMSEGEFYFELKLPEGASLAATDRTMKTMEEAAAAEPAIDRYYATIGSRLVSGGVSVNNKAENLGQLNLVMKDRGDAEAELLVAENLRRRFSGLPDVEVKFGRPAYFSLKTPVEVIVFGEDLDELRAYSLEVAHRLEKVPGLVDVRSSLEAGNPELQVVFDRERLAALGLDMGTLSETLKNRVLGVVPTRFKEEDRQIDIRIRNREQDRASAEDVRNLIVPGPDGTQLRLLAVADVSEARGPAEIHRLQQQRAAVVSANLEERSLGAAIADVEQVLADDPPPPGMTTELGGQNAEMKTSFNSLRFALALAVFLVYLVMAATFESFLHPFLVLFTIPLALVGVVAGLLATGTTITVIVLIGTVMLVGIVVNNAIVLIDTINRMRRAGVEKREAVIRAGHVRLRPILMTTLTTILGLLPMAMAWGEGAELRSPLAITVASGLAFSTMLTLLVIPAAYVAVPSRIDPPAEDVELETGSED